MLINDQVFIAEVTPQTYIAINDGSLAAMPTSKLLSTWQELDANGRKTKSMFTVDLTNIENAIRCKVLHRLASLGLQVIY